MALDGTWFAAICPRHVNLAGPGGRLSVGSLPRRGRTVMWRESGQPAARRMRREAARGMRPAASATAPARAAATRLAAPARAAAARVAGATTAATAPAQ